MALNACIAWISHAAGAATLTISCGSVGQKAKECQTASFRILETMHPLTYYLPATAFRPGALLPRPRTSFCEWKGVAQYFSVSGGGRISPDAVWGYADPARPYAALRDHMAVYAGRMDA